MFTVLIFVTRRGDLTPSEFRHHWENEHIPLLQRLAGQTFPVRHTRHYLQQPAVPLVGDSADVTYDAFAVVQFASKAAFDEFVPVMSSPDVVEDEDRFTDRGRMKAVVLEDVRETRTANGHGLDI
ncbi:EthD domain-containing protein [Aspergillus egyptiacus]|nr:EthD domain-containing protein [Aspergillus egyptiacus]